MRLRYWLSDVFQDEATDAGEGASGGSVVDSTPASDVSSTTSTETVDDTPSRDVAPSHAENVAFVKQWAAGDSTVTTTETTKEIPVETTSTDAVSTAGDAVATSGNEQDELLLSLAEAYDFTREELKGLSNEGLKSVLARERRLRASEISIDGDKTDTKENAETTAATSTATAPKEQSATEAQQEVSFAQVAEVMTSKLLEEGYSEEAVQREVALAKQRWDREEAILSEARQARQEAQMTRQQYEQQQRVMARQVEINNLFGVVDKFVSMGHEDVFGKRGDANATPEQRANLEKFVQYYDVIRSKNPAISLETASHRAFAAAFPEVIAKRTALDHSRKILTQANRVMGSPVSAKAPEKGTFNGNPWDSPAIVRHWERMQRNRT